MGFRHLNYNWVKYTVYILEMEEFNMTTAKEMYKFCCDNDFGEGMNKKWGLKHFSIIEQALSEDEDAILCFIGLHNYVSATKHDNNYAYAVTNKRIIMAQQKMIGQNFQSVAIDKVNDITMKTSMMWGIVTIDAITECFNVGVNKSVAKNINKAIHDALYSVKNEQKEKQIISQSSAADEILKYKNLLDIGAITQEEFDEKKKELLK